MWGYNPLCMDCQGLNRHGVGIFCGSPVRERCILCYSVSNNRVRYPYESPPPPPGQEWGGGWVPQLESLCGAESWLVLFSQSVVVLDQYIMCHHWCLHWLGPQGLSVSVHQVERSVSCIEYRKSPAVSCRLSGTSDKPYFRYVSTTQCSADIVQAFSLSSRGPSYLVTKPWLLTISLNCIEMNRRLLVNNDFFLHSLLDKLTISLKTAPDRL